MKINSHNFSVQIHGKIASAFTVIVGALPFVLIIIKNVSIYMFVIGGVAWLSSLLIKIIYSLIINKYLELNHNKSFYLSITEGCLSATSELGITAIYFCYFLSNLLFIDIVSFGLGVSSAEIFSILIYSIWHQHSELEKKWIKAAQQSILICYMVPIERILTMGLHITSRILIFFSIHDHLFLLGLFSFVGFSIVDGVASHGHKYNWNWYSPKIALRYYFFISAVVILQLVAITWHTQGHPNNAILVPR